VDRFDAMSAFARVVEAGSFTKAADTLQMSKTSVTQLVQQLEARLRVKLLHRTTRRLKVTPDGLAFYERVLRLLADLDDAETSLSGAAASPRGLLRVDVPAPLARLVLVPALADFHARYPEIQIDMGVSDRRVDLISDNVDCVLRGGDLTDPGLVARKVGELPIIACAAPAYLARHGTPQHPRELQAPQALNLPGHPDVHGHHGVGFLSSRTGRVMPVITHCTGEHLELQPRYRLAVDDGNAYLAAGLAGLGVLWVPHYMASPHLAHGDLVPLFEGWQVEPMPLYLAYRPNRHVSAKLRVFIDWVAALLAPRAPSTAPGARPRRRA